MKILFHLPRPTLHRCFAPRDLDRLASRHTLVLPTTDVAIPPDRCAEGAQDSDVIVTGWGTPRLADALLDAMPKARLVAHSAGSTKHLLPASFWSRGIRLSSANEALGVGVAETTIALIIAGLKGFFPLAAVTRTGEWRTSAWTVRETYQMTIGLIGASKIGRHVIRLLKSFEVETLVADPYLSADEAQRLGVEAVSLDELLTRSDVVSLHAPALESTRHMLGAKQFAAMKDDAIFINTARGMIVDEAALSAELAKGRLFAFIDVTDPEPPAPEHPFRKLPNCVLLPHIAGAVTNGCLRQGRSIVDQILEFESGQKMHGEIGEEQWKVMA